MKFCYNTNFTLPKNPKDLDLSYKTDLDLWDCFGRKKNPSYNQRNTVISLGTEKGTLKHVWSVLTSTLLLPDRYNRYSINSLNPIG